MSHRLNPALGCLVLALAWPAAQAQEGLSAKSLFFATDGSVMSVPTAPAKAAAPAPAASVAESVAKAGPPKGPAPAKPAARKTAPNLGAGYFVRLRLPDGTFQDVLASRSFKSGEKFQLGVKVNRPSYVYIYNEDPDGKVTQLYPQPGQNNYVDAMGVVFLPAQGAFQFDDRPGMEQLSVMLSPKAMDNPASRVTGSRPDLVSDPMRKTTGMTACGTDAPKPGAGGTQVAMADTTGGLASKGIGFTSDEPSCAPVAQLASKAIVFSDDPAPGAGGQVASYVVKQQSTQDDPLLIKLKLLHR